MRRRNLITSVIQAIREKANRTAAVGFVWILQISHKIWDIPEFAVRLQKIRNGVKSRFLYRFLKTNNTPIELLWFKFGVLFTWRHHPDLNRGVKVLQTSALPLGYGAKKIWSGLRGSNPPPRPWQGRALPNELNPRKMVPPIGIEPTTRGFSVPCSTN